MALSNALADNGTPPETVDTTASVTFIPGTGITGSHLNVNAVVPDSPPRTSRGSPRKRSPDAPSRPRSAASRSRSRRRSPRSPGGGRVVLADACRTHRRSLAASLKADGVPVTPTRASRAHHPDEVQWLGGRRLDRRARRRQSCGGAQRRQHRKLPVDVPLQARSRVVADHTDTDPRPRRAGARGRRADVRVRIRRRVLPLGAR